MSVCLCVCVRVLCVCIVRESWRALYRQSLDKVPDGRAAELSELVKFVQDVSEESLIKSDTSALTNEVSQFICRRRPLNA